MAKEYFKEYERYQLELLLNQKTPVKEIAKILNRSKTTIYREIKLGTVEMVDTNLKPYKKYCADRGQQVQDERSHNKGKEIKLGNDLEFVKFMEQMILEQRYSPVAILEHIKKNNLVFKTTVCFKTIYNYVNSGMFLNVTAHATKKERKGYRKETSGKKPHPHFHRTKTQRHIRPSCLRSLGT